MIGLDTLSLEQINVLTLDGLDVLPLAGWPPPRFVQNRVPRPIRERMRDRLPPPAHRVPIVPARGRFYLDARGRYRVFNGAEYRFYRNYTSGVDELTLEQLDELTLAQLDALRLDAEDETPEEGDLPFDSNATLPYTSGETFDDRVWYLAVTYFNGVLESGFYPIGPNGETYLRLEISGGAEVGNPPAGPQTVYLEPIAAGAVRVLAVAAYDPTADGLPEQWAITYTTDGSDPAEDSPDATESLTPGPLAVLQYDLPAQAHGTTVKVRVQTRRNDGTDESPEWVYSDGSTIHTATADATGPSAPVDLDAWRGPLPR